MHPETVNRRTDNAMTKRKRTNNDLQTLHNKLNIEKGYRNKTGDNSGTLKGLGLDTFNNISVIPWRSVLLLEETRVPGENH